MNYDFFQAWNDAFFSSGLKVRTEEKESFLDTLMIRPMAVSSSMTVWSNFLSVINNMKQSLHQMSKYQHSLHAKDCEKKKLQYLAMYYILSKL